MMTNKQLLAVAIKQLGNTGGKYRKYVNGSGSWCDMFVYWLFNANGCGSLITWKGQQRTYCPASIKWCRQNLAQIPPYLAMACDIMYFDWDKNGVPNHIGVVERKENTAIIHTIEGNTSGGIVARKKRNTSYDCGIFRPHFVPTGLKKEKLAEDGDFQYKSVYMLQVALNIQPDGILGKGTVSALQKRAGLTGKAVDGAWGATTSRAVQKLVGLTGKAIDGQFGKNSTVALQRWINKECGYDKPTAPQPSTPAKKGYSGAFPKLPTPKIAECTRSVNGMRKHSLLSGDYILRFKSEERRYKMTKFSLATAINKNITYSNHPKFEDKIKSIGYNLPKVRAIKTSANCSNFVDGAVGAVTGKFVRDLGAKHNKAYLGKTNFFNSYKYSKGSLLAGDICGTSKHTWVIIQGVCLSVGCEGAEVKKMQSFLNWAGYNCGLADGDFGMKTLSALKAFQKNNSLKSDGLCGNKTIEKMKAVKK